MTWFLIMFTGWAVSITNQYETPYCVAHAVANCGSLYGYKWDADYYTNKLGIWDGGYDVYNLPNALSNMRISKPKTYTRNNAIKEISDWPVLLNIWSKKVHILKNQTITRHLVCAVWYDNNYIYIANHMGTGRWYNGYGRIASWDISFVTLQTLWSKTLTPSLITLTDKKEDSQESNPTVKSLTTKKRNTRKRFLKPLD